ncbi:MAG: hypothetical protein K2X11_20710 [Acetobacteraceae bacterium]|nr:hypothetical protein [Acetobacteraceae bacterium]
MTPMRSLFVRSLIAGAALLPAGALAQQACLQPAEKTAFDIRALQSQLMVVAITCGLQDDYNRFVTGHQPDLANAFRTVGAHFRRVGGGQRAQDSFITDLANRQSQVGISQGMAFCQNQAPLFPLAIAARGRDQLAALSVQQQIPNQYQPPLCATPARAQGQQRAQGQSQQRPQGQQQPRPAQQQPRPAQQQQQQQPR